MQLPDPRKTIFESDKWNDEAFYNFSTYLFKKSDRVYVMVDEETGIYYVQVYDEFNNWLGTFLARDKK